MTVKDFEPSPSTSIEHMAPSQSYKDLGPAQKDAQSMNRIGQLVCAFWGPGMVLFFIVGAVLLSGYWPPEILPGAGPVEVLEWYQTNNTQLKVGLVLMTIAYSVMCWYGVGMAAQTRRKEGAFPVWTYVQLVCMACGTAQIVIMGAVWYAAAFRAGGCSDMNPCHLLPGSMEYIAYAQNVQMMHDLGWMILLGTWMPFTFWAWALGAAILLDKTGSPVFPRWSGYMSLLAGASYICGQGDLFFFEGAFGWNGIFALYWVFVIFGAWVVTFAFLTYRNVQRGYVHTQDIATR